MKIKIPALSQDHKALLENVLSMSSLQLANYLLPLITMPYLVRVLGPGKYGALALAQAVMDYLVNLTDYGFNMTATRIISIERDNPRKIAEVYSTVLVIKLALMIVSAAILALLIAYNATIQRHALAYIFTFGIVVGNVLFPTWFFRGIEQMKYIALLDFTMKMFFTISIFFVIKNESDYAYVPLLTSLGYLGEGIAAQIIIYKNYGVRYVMPTWESIVFQVKDGFSVFISTLTNSFYVTMPTVMLGWMGTEAAIGYYAAGERLIKAVQRMISPLSVALFPYLSRLSVLDKKQAGAFITKVVGTVGLGTFIIAAAICILAEWISNIILGGKYVESISVLRLLSFSLFFNSVGTMLGSLSMIALGYASVYSRFIAILLAASIILNLILIPRFMHNGAALTLLITSIFMAVMAVLILKRKGVILSGGRA